MSVVGSYSVGGTYSVITNSVEYSTLDELLIQLPNNTSNSIVAQNIRDSVLTLWNRIEDVNLIAASGSSASSYFTNTNPVPYTVGGVTAGTTFTTPTNMQTMWDQLLYPYVAPSDSLSFSNMTREYGNPLGLTLNSIVLNWSVTKHTNTIISIIVDGVPQIPTGLSQIGTQTTEGTHSISPTASEVNIFSMSVSDGVVTSNTTATLTWKNQIYWGNINLSSIGNPNLTMNPGSASLVASVTTDSNIMNLIGAGVGSGQELSETKNKTYMGINGAGKYLIFAWPSSVPGANTPIFSVNGFYSTAFTRVRTASPFTNQYGFTTNYEVWVSNTYQNSPLNIIIS